MKYLVTGGAGFIGSNLVDSLIADGHEVVVIDNLSTGKIENVNDKAIKFYDNAQELSPCTFLFENENFDCIFHLAALARIQPSFLMPMETHDANVNATASVLEFARVNKTKVVFAGTSSMYHDMYANPYTFTKGVCEQYCEMYNKVFGIPVAIARFFNVYGPRQLEDGIYSTVVGIFERQHRNGEPLTVTGTGEKRRDFTHVDDIVSGLIAMSKDEWDTEVFNLGTGKNYSINELADMFGGEKRYLPDRPGEAQTTLADISLSREKLEWKPTKDLETYIKGVLNAV